MRQILDPVLVEVNAELQSALVNLQVMHVRLGETQNVLLEEGDSFRVDLALTPRIPTLLCYTDHWASYHFERSGTMFVLPPRHAVRVISGLGVNSSIVCHLPIENIGHLIDEEIKWTDCKIDASRDVASPVIGELLIKLAEEARRPGLASEILIETYALQASVHLFRYFKGTEEQRLVAGGLAPWRLRLIEERLRNLESLPTLAELASLCQLSVRHLARGFRASRGVSVGAYVTALRLEKAKTLLADGKSVKAVAHLMGFGSPSSFCHAFRKSSGVSPKQFRNEYRL